MTAVALDAALVFGGLIGALALCEITARVLRAHYPATFTAPHQGRIASDEAWRIRANDRGVYGVGQYSYDANGFRNRADAPFDRTVLFIGDSFTFGYGVNDDETFPAFAEQRLAERGVRARCLNAGQIRFGTAEEFRLMARLLAAHSIDAVVLQVLPENDLQDNWEDGGFALVDGRLVANRPAQKPWPIQIGEALGDIRRDWDSAALAALARVAFLPEWLSDAAYEDQYQLEAALLRQVVATVDEARIPLLMIAVPTEPAQRDVGPTSKYARVRQLITESGAASIDIEPMLSNTEAYIANDGHFSVAGNAVVGRAIAEYLAGTLRGP